MKQTSTIHKALSILLMVTMVFSMSGMTAFAEGTIPPHISDECPHHTVHTKECRYEPSTPCNHEHTEDCSATPETCRHVHDSACGFTPGNPCEYDWTSCAQCIYGILKFFKMPFREQVCESIPASDVVTVSNKAAKIGVVVNGVCQYAEADKNVVIEGKHGYLTLSALEDAEDGKKTAVVTYSDIEEKGGKKYGHLSEGEPDTDMFTIRIQDAGRNNADKKLTIGIQGTNDAPELISIPTMTVKRCVGATVSGTLEFYDADWNDRPIVDVDFDVDSEEAQLMAAYGTVTVGPVEGEGGYHEATISYAVTKEIPEDTSSDKFEVRVSDPHGGTVSQFMSVEVNPTILNISDAGKYVEITATGYSVGGGEETPYVGDYIITGTATSTSAAQNHVMVSGGTHNITLKNADIRLSDEGKCAFMVEGNSTVNLTLTGTNTLQSGRNRAGLQVTEGNTLTITEASTGSLTAQGGEFGAGIGGGYQGAGGTVSVDGNALVYAKKGSDAPHHIGAGKDGSGGTINKNGGIIFEGNTGEVYGYTLEKNFTVEAAQTLEIVAGKTLTVPSGITLTNNGAINNVGTAQNDGIIISKGTLSGNGSLTGEGVVPTTLTESMISLDQDRYVYTGSAIQPTVAVSPVTYWDKEFNFVEDTDFTVGYSANTAAGTATVTITPKSSKLTGSAIHKTFTIAKSNSALGLTTNESDNTFTYGDSITFTANVSIPATKARAAAMNTVDFYCGSEKLGTASLNESGGTGTATFTYDTKRKGIALGEQTIAAQYGGSGNLNGQTAAVTVTLNKKTITNVVVNPGQSKDYDGNSNFTGVLLTLNEGNILGGDTVTATAKGTASSENVGAAHSFTCTSVTLGGIHSGYYSLAHSEVTGNVEIKAIDPVYSVADQKINGLTLTAIQAAKTATGVNNEIVAGTLTWAESSGGSALSDGYIFTGVVGTTKTLYWTFKPTSGNYNTLSGSTVFTLTDKEVPVLTVGNIEKTYDGKAVTAVTGTAKAGETPVAGTFVFDGTPPTMQDAKTYNVTVKFTPTDSETYEEVTTRIAVTIRKAAVEIAATLSDTQIVEGNTLPTPSICYGGLVSGESLTPATTATFSGMPSSSTKGTYTITWSNKAAMQAEIEALPAYKNYTASYKDSVTLQISEKSSGGSTGGGSGGNPTPPSESKPDTKPPVTEDTNAKINSDKDGVVTANADDKEIAKAIEKAQKADKGNGIAITLNIKTKENAKSLEVALSASTITALTNAKVTQFTINNGLATMTLDLAALKALAGGEVKLSISKVDVKILSAEAQNAIGNRPVFRFGATVGGKAVTDFKGGSAGLQMTYTLTTTEQAGNLCGVYVDGSGKVNWLEASSYDPITGMMLISAQHFSIYGVGYKQSTPKFADTANHWAKNDIDFVVARGLLSGTSSTTFAPETSMTRGMFVTALGRLAGADTKQYNSTKFTDVKADAYYSPYVAWANTNNIVNGTTDTTFSPDKAISRQEMAVMLGNYSKAIGYKLPIAHAAVSFVDAGSIASWAKDAVEQMQMAGIIMGKSGNRFDPTATATRAEAAALLRCYVELVVNTETAEGIAPLSIF